jgi:hypothetical protein
MQFIVVLHLVTRCSTGVKFGGVDPIHYSRGLYEPFDVIMSVSQKFLENCQVNYKKRLTV